MFIIMNFNLFDFVRSWIAPITFYYLCLSLKRNQILFQKSWLLRLMDHLPDLQSDKITRAHLHQLSKFISLSLKSSHEQSFGQSEDLPWTHELIKKCYGILRINAFGFNSSAGGEGRALFPLVALASHSCQPNVQHVQSLDGKVTLIAQRAIKKGEELTLSYINQFQGKSQYSPTTKSV